MNIRLSMLVSVGFCANVALDEKRPAPFTFDELYRAAENAQLVELLEMTIDDSGVIASWSQRREDRSAVERALDDAAETLRGRELRKVGIGDSPLCMVVAIVLEAIQQNDS